MAKFGVPQSRRHATCRAGRSGVEFPVDLLGGSARAVRLLFGGRINTEERTFLHELEAEQVGREFEVLFAESRKQPPEQHTSGLAGGFVAHSPPPAAGPILFWRSVMKLYATIAVVGLCLAVTHSGLWAQDSKAEKERAIAELKKLGGKVEVDTRSPDMPVVAVDLKHTKAVDASLEHLKGLTKLEALYLKDTEVTDDGLAYVKGLTDLEVLELGKTKVTDKGLKDLEGFTKLQRLDLGGTQVTDKGLEHISRMGQLDVLSLDGTNVTDAGLVHLKRLNNLKTLNLESTAVSDAGLVSLKGLTNLRQLRLGGTKVTDAGVRELREELPMVRVSR